MFVVDDLLIAAAVGLASVGLGWCVGKWQQHCSKQKRRREFLIEVPMTDADKQAVERCCEILRREFPQGIEAKVSSLSGARREKLFRDLIGKLNSVYGVDIVDVCFRPASEVGNFTFGYYNIETNQIVFNKDFIRCNDPGVLKQMLETIFHEMRHAYQYKAITTTGTGSEQQRRVWALNMVDYIPADVDFALYQQQAVENDARAFAALVLKDF